MLLAPGYESLRVALGLYPSVKGRTLLCHSHIPDILLLLLLACTRWCLAVSGNLLPSSCDAGRAGAVASGTFSWRHLALWAVPRAVSPCATAGAFPWCDSCLSPCPSAQPHQQQGEPHALSGHQMGACRKVSMGTRGRKNLPTEFSAIMSGTGEQAGE